MLFSINKMLRSLSNVGRGFCVGRSRVVREVWVSNSAMSGWVELAKMCGYWPPGAVRSTPWCEGERWCAGTVWSISWCAVGRLAFWCAPSGAGQIECGRFDSAAGEVALLVGGVLSSWFTAIPLSTLH
jgi:hypothetical protein